MRIKSIKITTSYPTEKIDPTVDLYLFNEDCQLVCEEHTGLVVEHHYLPDGNEYETIKRSADRDASRTVYDYDDDGDLLADYEKDKYGSILSRTYYDWIKPGRVRSTCVVFYKSDGSYEEPFCWREYFDREGHIVFTRGYGWSEIRKIGAKGHLLLSEVSLYSDKNPTAPPTVVRKYSEDGLLMEQIEADGEIGRMMYDFDQYGNWIRMTGRIDGEPISIIKERVIEYAPGIWDCRCLSEKLFTLDCHYAEREWTHLCPDPRTRQ